MNITFGTLYYTFAFVGTIMLFHANPGYTPCSVTPCLNLTSLAPPLIMGWMMMGAPIAALIVWVLIDIVKEWCRDTNLRSTAARLAREHNPDAPESSYPICAVWNGTPYCIPHRKARPTMLDRSFTEGPL